MFKEKTLDIFLTKNKKIEFCQKSFPQKKMKKFRIFLIRIFEKIFFIFVKTYFYIKGKKFKLKTNLKKKLSQKISPKKVS